MAEDNSEMTVWDERAVNCSLGRRGFMLVARPNCSTTHRVTGEEATKMRTTHSDKVFGGETAFQYQDSPL